MNLTKEQSLLLYAISHQYILLNNEGEVDEDVKRALCGTYNAMKIAYKIPDLMKDIDALEHLRLIAKNFKEKRYEPTLAAKHNPELTVFDEKNPGKLSSRMAMFEDFMNTFWVIFCSFLRLPLGELLKEIDDGEPKQFSELNGEFDITTSVLCELAIKSGLVTKDAEGIVSLTENGKNMVNSQKGASAS